MTAELAQESSSMAPESSGWSLPSITIEWGSEPPVFSGTGVLIPRDRFASPPRVAALSVSRGTGANRTV